MHQLRGRKLSEQVRRKGSRWRGKHMNAVFLSDRESNGKLFVGTPASKKLDKSAVRRNKMRRRCRESLRVTLKNITSKTSKTSTSSTSLRLILTPKYSSLTCDFEELIKASEALISHLTKYA